MQIIMMKVSLFCCPHSHLGRLLVGTSFVKMLVVSQVEMVLVGGVARVRQGEMEE